MVFSKSFYQTAWVVTEFNLNAYLHKLDKFEVIKQSLTMCSNKLQDYHYVDEEPKKKEEKPEEQTDDEKKDKKEEEKKTEENKGEEIPKSNPATKAITDGKTENPKWNVSQPVMKGIICENLETSL